MDVNKAAEDMLKAVGGKENVKDFSHCFTRLRFVLKDQTKVEKEVVKHLEGVLQVVEAGGQLQVVLGSRVTKIFGIPVIKGAWTIGDSTRVFSYTESVIPILLAVLALLYVERALKKLVPTVLQLILVPGISLLVFP